MKTYIYFFSVVITIFALVSCGKPPKGTPLYNALEKICEYIDVCNTFSGQTDELKKFLLGKLVNSQGIFYCPKNAVINVDSYFDMTSDLFFSIDKNRFYLVRGFYITFKDKNTYLSPDGKRWVVFYSNPVKNKDAKYFEGFYHLDHDYNSQTNVLNIKYTMAVKVFDEENLPYTNVEFDRPIIDLSDVTSDTFYVQNDKDVNTKLDSNILYVPPGTVCNLTGPITGNLVNASASETINVKFVRDIFVYSKMLPSMSFDNKNWQTNLFKLKVHTATLVTTSGNKVVDYHFAWDWNYE